MNFFQKKVRQSKAGFTLIEIMVVIAIIALLSAIAIPNLFNPERRTKKIARELMGSMQQTRILAVKTNSSCAIIFDDTNPSNPRYLICTNLSSVPGASWTTPSQRTVRKIVEFTHHGAGVVYKQLPSGTAVSFGGNPSNPKVLVFNERGTCNAGWVYIAFRNSSFKIGTRTTGIIRIQRWNGSSYS